jgi:hypothetical protein
MAKSSNAEPRRRALAILVGHNLPWALFTGWALIRVIAPGSALACPIDSVLGWCPSCGLTGAYAALLSGQAPHHPLLWPVLALFAASALWSLHRARAVLRQVPTGAPAATASAAG